MTEAPEKKSRWIWTMIGWWVVFALVVYFVVFRLASYVGDAAYNDCAKELVSPIELNVGEAKPVEQIFDTKMPCFDTGVHLQAGERYLVTVDAKDVKKWLDDTIPASPKGFVSFWNRLRPIMVLAWPTRRHLKHGWFVVMGRIGRHGTAFRVGAKNKITAAETGRLYLYVNDAIPPFCIGGCSKYYDNNHGTGQVTVRRLAK